jgi:hypothetical protein
VVRAGDVAELVRDHARELVLAVEQHEHPRDT